MDKPKGWRVNKKEFLQPPQDACMAAAGYTVSLEYWPNRKKGGDGYRAHVSAELQISREAEHHYIERRADLRPIRKMRKLLDEFEEQALKAITEAEEYNNAKS